ncbi:MAG: hypothetical protein HY047_08785 [Acidobacteria bacterium]|nr:hypothetical protein [Acidobacteriota bacterium]
MKAYDRGAVVAAFEVIVGGRNFVTFDELVDTLGVDRDALISLKVDFQNALRREHPHLNVTSRIDLDPPGFEIRE